MFDKRLSKKPGWKPVTNTPVYEKPPVRHPPVAANGTQIGDVLPPFTGGRPKRKWVVSEDGLTYREEGK